MYGLRRDSAFARMAGESLAGDRFRLVDIGADGGVATGWTVFGAGLTALAVAEGAPAGAEPTDCPGVVRASWPLNPRGRPYGTPPLDRFSDHRARDLTAARAAGRDPAPIDDWVREAVRATAPPPPPAAAPGPSLADFIAAQGFAEADFLRLEAGPGDFDLLQSLAPMLGGPALLGVAVRGQLHGDAGEQTNSLANMDRLLRGLGFDLFVLAPILYSAAALPWPFLDSHPDHAAGGRPAHAQAVYLRDPAAAEAAPAIAKAAAIRALFNLPDQAAELLLAHRAALAPLFDVEAALDLLALQIQEDDGSRLSYRALIAAFEANHPRFYDAQARRYAWLEGLQRRRVEDRARINQLEQSLRGLIGQVRADGRLGAHDPRADADRRSLAHPAHHWVFDHFAPYHGPVTSQFHVDYIGTRTSGDFGEWSIPWAVDDWRAEPPPIDEEYFEWIDVLQSVLEAGPVFTMLELGAGYGRWSARAALAARQLVKAGRFGVAEAEPKHQAWLARHLAVNGVQPSDYRLFPQAIAGAFGEVAFTVAAPAEAQSDTWFGQSIMAADLAGSPVVGDYHGLPVRVERGWRLIVVPQIPLSEVLKPYDLIDLADFDLQAAEGDAIAEAIGDLTRKVRRMHIGTHSHEIEAQLRDLLPRHGWICLRDYPCHGDSDTPFGRCAFVDGVQSWINPALG